MVTGSHNPPDQNGFKMLLAKDLTGGGPVYGEAIKALAALAAKDDYARGTGHVKNTDMREAYIAAPPERLSPARRPLKVVWDCGNGAAGEIALRLTASLPGKHTVLFAEIDGHFPHHHPDPTVEENLRDLQNAVRGAKSRSRHRVRRRRGPHRRDR